MNRRQFVTELGMSATAAAFATRGRGQEPHAPAGDYLLESQRMPDPQVALPTDGLPEPEGPKKRLAAITTAWWKYSHADDIVTKFIEGYSVVGRSHLPHCRVVGLFVEQFPERDISRGMAARYRIPLFETPEEALRLGGEELAVDGVLLIGEHGDYPLNERGQKLYPRRRLFESIVEVFRASGRCAPVFNDKHLSYSWENARWMFEQSRRLDFPLMAGSSLPVTWRRPPLAFRPGIPLEAALVAGSGSFESYGFHALEALQTFVEKRRGGEVGVRAVQALEGDAAWESARAGDWPAELMPAAIEPVPESRKRPYEPEALRRATVFRVEYSDGFVGAVCLNTRAVSEFCFAAQVRGRRRPAATWFYLPKPQRDHFSFLCNHIEVMFRSGEPSYPVERTLLVTGVLDALHTSKVAGGRRIETPHLSELAYTPAPDHAAG